MQNDWNEFLMLASEPKQVVKDFEANYDGCLDKATVWLLEDGTFLVLWFVGLEDGIRGSLTWETYSTIEEAMIDFRIFTGEEKIKQNEQN